MGLWRTRCGPAVETGYVLVLIIIIIIIIIIIEFLTSQLQLGNIHISWDM